MKNNNNHNDHSSSSSFYMNRHNINPLLIVFFTINDLKLVGKKLPIYFLKRDPSKFPHFYQKKKLIKSLSPSNNSHKSCLLSLSFQIPLKLKQSKKPSNNVSWNPSKGRPNFVQVQWSHNVGFCKNILNGSYKIFSIIIIIQISQNFTSHKIQCPFTKLYNLCYLQVNVNS